MAVGGISSTKPDAATAAAIRDSLQFGTAPLTLLPLQERGDLVQGTGAFAGRYVRIRQPVRSTGSPPGLYSSIHCWRGAPFIPIQAIS